MTTENSRKQRRVRDGECAAATPQLALSSFCNNDTHPLALMLDRPMNHREEQVVLDAAARIMARRYGPKKCMTSPTESQEFFKSQIAHLAHEVFGVLFLSTRHAIIDFQILHQGTIDGTEVHPRLVVTRALELGAAAVILTHNHPSGHSEPSAADRAVTNQLKQALAFGRRSIARPHRGGGHHNRFDGSPRLGLT